MKDSKVRFIVNVIFFALIVAIFSLALNYAVPLIMPFIIAFAIAAAVQSPIRILSERIKFIPKKGWAAIILVLTFAVLGTGIVFICISLVDQFIGFLKFIPDFVENTLVSIDNATEEQVNEFFGNFPSWMGTPLRDFYDGIAEDLPGQITSFVNKFSTEILSSISSIGADSVTFLAALVSNIPGAIVVVLITIIATFFIGLDYDGVKSLLLSLFPGRIRPQIQRVKNYATDTVFGLLKTYALLMLLTFAELTVGLGLINLFKDITIPYVVPLAMIISLIDILPVLGIGTVLLPWGVINIILGDWKLGIMILVLYGIITVLRNTLEPKIIGEKYGMHPLITLVALYVGGRIFGILGVFMLPLTLIIIKRLYDVGALTLYFDKSDIEEAHKAREAELTAAKTKKDGVFARLLKKIKSSIAGKKKK
ncbi:MAG: sporulation integral membrane protein YtvI [Oscillospiraceae bacterium]|jgi:sporulation integral membrane protein YtvI|nr:sporulation integral membrane protein YtvI [Oscillospiraceae bacterium]